MQSTLFAIYLYQYMFLLIQLLLISLIWVPYHCYAQSSLLLYFLYWRIYTPLYGFVSFIFINLAGLPPVLAFFIKLNILGYVFQAFNPILDFIIFSIFFFNILYYLQVFKFRSEFLSFFSIIRFDNISFNHKFLAIYPTTKYFLNNFFYLLQVNQLSHYTVLFYLAFLNIFFALSIFFFFDVYCIFYNCCGF